MTGSHLLPGDLPAHYPVFFPLFSQIILGSDVSSALLLQTIQLNFELSHIYKIHNSMKLKSLFVC